MSQEERARRKAIRDRNHRVAMMNQQRVAAYRFRRNPITLAVMHANQDIRREHSTPLSTV